MTKNNQVTLSSPSADWAQQFKDEATKVFNLFGTNLYEIHHIGSTAIAGIKAKPIIDMIPVVKSLTELDTIQSKLEAEGYEYKGEFGIPNRRYLVVLNKDGSHKAHIHVFEDEDIQIGKHLYFKDKLSADRDLAKRYEELKVLLASEYKNDKEKYQAGKEGFINDVLKDFDPEEYL